MQLAGQKLSALHAGLIAACECVRASGSQRMRAGFGTLAYRARMRAGESRSFRPNAAQIWIAAAAATSVAVSFFLLVVPPDVLPAADAFYVDVTLPAWPPLLVLVVGACAMAINPRARGWLSWTALGLLTATLVVLGLLLLYWLAGAAAL